MGGKSSCTWDIFPRRQAELWIAFGKLLSQPWQILDILMFIGRNDLILRREAHAGKGIPRVMIYIISDYNKIPKQIETPKPME